MLVKLDDPKNRVNLVWSTDWHFSDIPPGRVFGSVGNHDLSWDRMDSLPRQPLGLLIEVGAYHDLNREPVIFQSQDGAVNVSVETFPYAEGEETIRNIMSAGPRQPGVQHRVGVVHAYGHSGEASSFFGQ